MLKPRPAGDPINDNRISAWMNRYADYHKRPTKHRLLSWINQFKPTDRDLAARILDAVEYWSHQDVEEALAKKASALPGWKRDRRARTGRWRFVAFARAAGESGNAMLHKFRIAAALTGAIHDEMFIDKRDLLREELTSDDTVVFVDDFAGTGKQICDCWKEVIEELLPGNPRIFLLLVAATAVAKARIATETRMKVVTARTLRARDDIFSVSCSHFEAGEQARILDYCRQVDPREPKGFGECGLVFVLAHNAPNNSIPILHSSKQAWNPIFPRR